MEDDDRETCRRLRFELLGRYAAGQHGTAIYEGVRRQLLDWLRAHQFGHLERAAPLLTELVAYARERAVVLALETGYHPHELPLPDGMAHLLERVPGLGAWLDTGHVGVQANLSLASFSAWFDAVGGRWTGAHFHDVVGLRDHLVPGMGTLGFGRVIGHLRPSVITTLEVDWYFDTSEVMAGRTMLESARSAAWRDPT
jgi:sugar phosphate isomerase/epimerase